MARLCIELFGPWQVTLDGSPVTCFGYDKVRALLAYLAVESDRVEGRDVLAGMLWPDLPEVAARRRPDLQVRSDGPIRYGWAKASKWKV